LLKFKEKKTKQKKRKDKKKEKQKRENIYTYFLKNKKLEVYKR
jgi:hypothetical protein